jgi:hypothetical protein
MTETVTPYHAETVLADAEKSIGLEVLDALLQEIQHQQKPWPQMNEEEQSDAIDRLRARVGTVIARLVNTVATADFDRAVVTVESLTAKDGAKAVVAVPRAGEAAHVILDRVGQTAFLVFTDTEQFTAGIESIKAQADQAELPLPEPTAEAA